MFFWEPATARVFADIRDANGAPLLLRNPDHALSFGLVTGLVDLLRGHACRDEPHQVALLVDNSKRGVTRPCLLARQMDDPF